MMEIRPATEADLPQLPEIEISAASLFRDSGLEIFAGEAPDAPIDFTPADIWVPILARGRIWVAQSAAGRLVAFLAAEAIEGRLHILELDVHRDAQGQGLGRRLVQTAIDTARDMGLAGASLTTFRDAPWNAPFYASLGFAIEEAPQGALLNFLNNEAARGLDPARRCAMVLRF